MSRSGRPLATTLVAALVATMLPWSSVAAQEPPRQQPLAAQDGASSIDPVRAEFSRTSQNIRFLRRGSATAGFTYEFAPAAASNLWPSHVEAVYRVDIADELPEDDEFAWLGEAGQPGWVTGAITGETNNRQVYLQILHAQVSVDPDDPRFELRVADVDAPDGGTYSLYETPPAPMINEDPDLDPYTPVGPVRTGTGTQADGSPQQAPDGGWVDLFDSVSQTRPDRLPTRTATTHRFDTEGMYCVTYDLRFRDPDGQDHVLSTLARYAVGDEVDAGSECGATPGDGGPTTPTVAGDPPSLEDGDDGIAYLRSGHMDGVFPILHGLEDGEPSLELASLQGSLSSDHEIISYDDLVIVLDDRTRNTVPEDDRADDWAFLGQPGSTFWLNDLGGAYQNNFPWVGVSTEHPSIRQALDLDTTDIQIRMDAVTGQNGEPAPGTFAIWGGSPTNHRWWIPSAELPISQRIYLGVHAHQDWGFTEPGVYCTTFSVELDLPDGSRVSDRGQLTWVVGNEIDHREVVPCTRTQETPEAPRKDLAPAETSTVEVVEAATLATSVQDGRLLVGLHQGDPTALSQGVSRSIDDTVIAPDVRENDDEYRASNLGWDQTRVHADDVEDDVTWRIVDVDGPGELTTVITGWSDTVFDRPNDVDERMLWPGGTSSVGATFWRFSEPGVYCVTMEWEATLAGEVEPQVAEHVATIVVDPEGESEVTATCAGTEVGDPARSPVPEVDDPVETSLSIEGLAHHYHTGDTVSLTAVQGPATDLDHYHWFTIADGSDEEVVVPGAGTDTLELVAGDEPALDGTQVIAKLYDDDHDVVASSDPVTIVIDDHDDDPVDPPFPFSDVSENSPHRDAIAELARRDITLGTTPTTYDPAGTVSRGQLASFIARSLGLEDRPVGFDDVGSGSVHAGAIGALVGAGWAEGFEDGTFRPWQPVPRDQVAAVLARLLELDQVEGADRFSDLGSTSHRDAINALADAEVVLGGDDGSYDPHDEVRRDQFASLLWRTLQERQG